MVALTQLRITFPSTRTPLKKHFDFKRQLPYIPNREPGSLPVAEAKNAGFAGPHSKRQVGA